MSSLPMHRSSGVQLHITSLPSARLGDDAYAFVDWLHDAGQSFWQVLPLGPPDRGGSPYRARSAFACWAELLERPDAPVSVGEEDDFRERQSYWIEDWGPAAGGREAVLDQVRFEREWLALRSYAADAGVRVIGDLPLYVAPGSVDHIRHPQLFAAGLVAGAPPDEQALEGQLWGNPVYDWPQMRREGYRWWIERIRRAMELFDVIRLDHFRGLVACWAIPEGDTRASSGRWRRGPLAAPLLAAREQLGPMPLIAADLGLRTAPVERLRARVELPGMAEMQLLCGSEDGEEDPFANASCDRVLYTATHNQDTLLGWWAGMSESVRRVMTSALTRRRLPTRDPVGALLQLALGTPAPLVMTQAQDLLGLPSSARMNVPGRAAGNWSWRLTHGALGPAHAQRLRGATAQAGRLP
jgi:4-alpha-glucanotransferase